ncbi:MAG: hypothetical protein MRECE_36c008 [Mycoplasmataceae bacterium CE_OT135]|nr:MAG: hypothetical protein MRECE_36c008 [Mycoplasmataceae bacterium CE_OT135]
MRKCNKCSKELDGKVWYSFRDNDPDAVGWCRECLIQIKDNYWNSACYEHHEHELKISKIVCPWC